MTEQHNKSRFWDVVSALKPGATIRNVKFFLGSNRNISAADLHDASATALRNIQMGIVKAGPAPDAGIEKRTLQDFA